MVKLLGLRNNTTKRKGKKRLSPTARTPELLRQQHPMYQYALNEYSQTVAAGTSNDAGRLSDGTDSWSAFDDSTTPAEAAAIASTANPPPPPPPILTPTPGYSLNGGTLQQSSSSSSSVSNSTNKGVGSGPPKITDAASSEDSIRGQQFSPAHNGGLGTIPSSSTTTTATSISDQQYYQQQQRQRMGLPPMRSPFEAEMPDATYEETYGDAYTGGLIKYVYPSGYQSMRPRSCPWKLSIIVCSLFTWLSVFIVGHCSDQAQVSQWYDEEANNDNNENDNTQIDDDVVVMDIRWCGSRPLYLMWVTSMLITGLAAAYCSVIGYIKVRDFAVGNSRSQPPGVVSDKSDYYVRIEDGVIRPSPSNEGSGTTAVTAGQYKKSIYQSDGTPLFWGAHIYRPTQAAVAITSR